jgi:hypothetical protein
MAAATDEHGLWEEPSFSEFILLCRFFWNKRGKCGV